MIWAFVIPILVAYVCLKFWFKRLKVCRRGNNPGEVRPPINTLLDNPNSVTYGIKSLHVPRVTGALFKFLVWLGYTRFGQVFVVPSIIKSSNLNSMDGLYIPENPTVYPTTVPPERKDHSKENHKLITKLFERNIREEGMVGFHFPTVADFVRMYRSGVCTPTDIAKAILQAISDSDKRDPPLRAIVQTDREVVMAMAEASTQRWKKGKTLSILDGIPIAIKEELRVEPYQYRVGTTFIPKITNGIPESIIAVKFRECGAVIIGVSNMHELGLGALGSNPNKYHLTARNPYDPNCYPGGSSSGSAVSVAAGLCPIAIGVDGGGSVRVPATTCGIVGIKPTFTLVDSSGQIAQDYSMGAPGPLCSSMLDTALALNVMCKQTDGDKNPLSLEGLGETRLDGMNIGVYWEYFNHANPEIVQKCKSAVSKMESLGAKIVEIAIPELEECRVAHILSIMSEFSNSLAVDLDEHFHELNLETHLVLNIGYHFSAVEYLNAQKQRTRSMAILKHLFNEEKIDAIVTPGAACPAPRIDPAAVAIGIADSVPSSELMHFSFLANLAGIPGLVLPVGYTSDGLPIGLQLMGPWYQEHKLLKIGWALEKTGDFPLKKPQVFYDLFEMVKE